MWSLKNFGKCKIWLCEWVIKCFQMFSGETLQEKVCFFNGQVLVQFAFTWKHRKLHHDVVYIVLHSKSWYNLLDLLRCWRQEIMSEYIYNFTDVFSNDKFIQRIGRHKKNNPFLTVHFKTLNVIWKMLAFPEMSFDSPVVSNLKIYTIFPQLLRHLALLTN